MGEGAVLALEIIVEDSVVGQTAKTHEEVTLTLQQLRRALAGKVHLSLIKRAEIKGAIELEVSGRDDEISLLGPKGEPVDEGQPVLCFFKALEIARYLSETPPPNPSTEQCRYRTIPTIS